VRERGLRAHLDEVLDEMEEDSLVGERNERLRESEGQRTETGTETCSNTTGS
jgi:hypothetical protein